MKHRASARADASSLWAFLLEHRYMLPLPMMAARLGLSEAACGRAYDALERSRLFDLDSHDLHAFRVWDPKRMAWTRLASADPRRAVVSLAAYREVCGRTRRAS